MISARGHARFNIAFVLKFGMRVYSCVRSLKKKPFIVYSYIINSILHEIRYLIC